MHLYQFFLFSSTQSNVRKKRFRSFVEFVCIHTHSYINNVCLLVVFFSPHCVIVAVEVVVVIVSLIHFMVVHSMFTWTPADRRLISAWSNTSVCVRKKRKRFVFKFFVRVSERENVRSKKTAKEIFIEVQQRNTPTHSAKKEGVIIIKIYISK